MDNCPNCGKELREDFAYCPFCATPLKPFCPSCKRELRAGYVACPYCGFRLDSGTLAKQLYRRGGKSLYLWIITALTFAGGIIDVIQGANEGSFQLANFLYQGPIPDLARYLALAQVPIGLILVLVGIVQLFIGYGLVYGKAFSRRYLLRMTGLTFLLSALIISIDEGISSIFTLPNVIFSIDVFFIVWAFLVLAVTYRYVTQQEVREILRNTTAPQPPSE